MSTHITLSPLDHIPPQNYVKIALYLPLKPSIKPEEAFEFLQQGLKRTFIHLPWLSGKVHWQQQDTPGWHPGQLEIRHGVVDQDSPAPYQLKMNKLDDDIEYEALKDSGFPIDEFEDHELLWAPFLADVENGAEVFVAQANFMVGGCIISMSTCHAASDGTAMVTIFKLWASYCKSPGTSKQGQTNSNLLLSPQSSDRGILDELWIKDGRGRPVSEMDAEAWPMIGLDPPTTSTATNGHSDDQGPPVPATAAMANSRASEKMKTGIFYISAANFSKLGKQCIEEAGSTELSSNDVVTALIWRSLLKARATAKEANGQPSNTTEVADLEIALDGRSEFSNDLPATYLGNVVFINRPTMPLSTLTSHDTTLGQVAKVIRKSASSINHTTLMDAYSLLRDIPDYRMRKLRFTSVDGSSMLVTSALSFSMQDICFGDGFFGNGGRPEAYRPLMSAFNSLFRISFILPRESHGGIEFVVSLFEDEMDLLLEDEEFSKFAMQIS
ncbi:hypothetical protein CC79DRAFT_1062438 [Sarocladium strictum]